MTHGENNSPCPKSIILHGKSHINRFCGRGDLFGIDECYFAVCVTEQKIDDRMSRAWTEAVLSMPV